LLFSIDAGDPGNPKFLDTLDWGAKAYPPPFTEFCNGMYAKDGYVYMTSRYQGIIIIDATNPVKLKRVDTVAAPEITIPPQDLRGWDHFMAMSDNYFLYLYDISSPLAPKYLYRYDGFQSPSSAGFVRPAYCVNNDTIFIMETTAGSKDTLRMKKIHTDGSISFLKNVNIVGYYTAVEVSGTYIYASRTGHVDDNYWNSLRIYSIGESFSPVFISGIKFIDPFARIQAVGNYIYCFTSVGGGFVIVDVHNPDKPEIAAEYRNSRLNRTRHMVILGDYVYFNSDENGLNVVRVDIPTNVENTPAHSSLSLSPAYPNPFTGSTNITYSLPSQEYITLEAYDMLGRKVQTLYSGIREPGNHAARFSANGLAAGMYRCILRSGSGMRSATLVVR
jgi:hypothetical protein